MSAIKDRTAANMPETYDGLFNSPLFGETFIDNKVDYVKWRLFGEIVAEGDEESEYNPLVLEYTAKLVALQLIRPGMDYWASQPVSESLTGTNETVSFTDRAKNMLELDRQLRSDLDELYPLVEDDILHGGNVSKAPGITTAGALITSNPPDVIVAPETAYPTEIPFEGWGNS